MCISTEHGKAYLSKLTSVLLDSCCNTEVDRSREQQLREGLSTEGNVGGFGGLEGKGARICEDMISNTLILSIK